ncbi:MAG: prepilin-type N-terminal cleavage/methylation domain-containing protein [bacterium]|nr:prepilin-type N-terminal cleavage/methylation domain-containing protein [bacterium]
MNNTKIRYPHAKNGFSLIETIIALFVLTVGATGAFIVISKTIHISPAVRQEIIAANLAQEGIEVVRNIRDNTLLQISDAIKQTGIPPTNPQWNDDIPATGPVGFQTRIRLVDNDDISSGWIVACCSAAKEWQQVYVQDATGFYANLCVTGACSTAGWSDSGFRRAVRIEKYPVGCSTECAEIYVKIKVFWNSDTEPVICPDANCILLESRLTKWVDYLGSFL